MRNKLLVAVLVLTLLVSATLIAGPAIAAGNTVRPGEVIWRLNNFKVVDPGVTTVSSQGTFINGYVMEASANARKSEGRLFSKGTFRVTLSLFSPAYDMPGQKAGMWYIVGDWNLVKTGARAKDIKIRHNTVTIAGRIQAELGFNPLADKSEWAALAHLPMSTIAGQWGRGDGSLVFNKDASADLSLKLILWPKQ